MRSHQGPYSLEKRKKHVKNAQIYALRFQRKEMTEYKTQEEKVFSRFKNTYHKAPQNIPRFLGHVELSVG